VGTYQHLKIECYGASTPEAVAYNSGVQFTRVSIDGTLGISAGMTNGMVSHIPNTNQYVSTCTEFTAASAAILHVGNLSTFWNRV
jgi:hypothetical protein